MTKEEGLMTRRGNAGTEKRERERKERVNEKEGKKVQGKRKTTKPTKKMVQ